MSHHRQPSCRPQEGLFGLREWIGEGFYPEGWSGPSDGLGVAPFKKRGGGGGRGVSGSLVHAHVHHQTPAQPCCMLASLGAAVCNVCTRLCLAACQPGHSAPTALAPSCAPKCSGSSSCAGVYVCAAGAVNARPRGQGARRGHSEERIGGGGRRNGGCRSR